MAISLSHAKRVERKIPGPPPNKNGGTKLPRGRSGLERFTAVLAVDENANGKLGQDVCIWRESQRNKKLNEPAVASKASHKRTKKSILNILSLHGSLRYSASVDRDFLFLP